MSQVDGKQILDGSIPLSKLALIYKDPAGLWLPPGLNGPWFGSGPDAALINGWHQNRFHDNADETLGTVFRLPDEIDLVVNPTMTLYFAMDTIQTGTPTIRFSNGSSYAGDGEVFPAASEGADVSVDVPLPVNELFTVVDTLDASLMTLGDLTEYHVGRVSSHADDDAVGHMGFFGGLFLYSKKVV